MRGKVKEVDTVKALVRVVLGKDPDGNEVLSPWVPYKQTAGAVKFHNPPSVGQVMAIRSETGDVEQGLAEPFRWNDQNEAPSQAGDEHVLTFGDVTLTLKGDALTFSIGGATFRFSSVGFEQTGGAMRHDGVAIDKTHLHTGVFPGGGISGPPQGG
jgi:phage baseplate assembly protein gpV